MRLSESLTPVAVTAQATLAAALVLTAVLASVHVFGGRVLDHAWARLVVIAGLVGAAYLGTNRDFYLPFLGPSAIPTSVLKVGSPSDASVAIAIDARPTTATDVNADGVIDVVDLDIAIGRAIEKEN